MVFNRRFWLNLLTTRRQTHRAIFTVSAIKFFIALTLEAIDLIFHAAASVWTPTEFLQGKLNLLLVYSNTTIMKTCDNFIEGGDLMVSALDSGTSGTGSGPGRGHCVVFLGKTLYFRNTPSGFMLQKPGKVPVRKQTLSPIPYLYPRLLPSPKNREF